jgi:hypothetical protein
MNFSKAKCFLIVLSLLLFYSCNTGPPAGSPETGYSIHGFVGNSPTEAAPNVMVLLFDAETSKPVASDKTNLFGKYKFEHLQPGYYLVKSGKVSMELVIIDKNQRLDIDLSAEDGTMNYAKDASKQLTDAVVGVTPPGKPGGDIELGKKLIIGKWYSYSGASSISGGGGSESQLAFCPDGSYYDSYEAGYYGTNTDQYGDATSSYGTASQSGAKGYWSIEGTMQSAVITIKHTNGSTSEIQVKASDENGCLYFDGRKHCYNGECN